VAVSVDADIVLRQQGGELLAHRRQQVDRQGAVGSIEIAGDKVLADKPHTLLAKGADINGGAVLEGFDGAHQVDACQELAEGIEVVEIVQLGGMAAATAAC